MEPAALANGRVCLAAAMEHGFVGPIDIPAEAFHPDLQPAARIIRETRERGGEGFSAVILHLIETTDPGQNHDLLRAQISEVATNLPHLPENVVGAAGIVRQYDRAKRRQHVLWGLNAANEQGLPIKEFLKQLEDIEVEAGTSGSKAFEFCRADQLSGKVEIMDFVEGLLTRGGASVIYGPSNCGKSFWIVDLGACVASRMPFRDELEVEQGAVVYIALEGAHGARNRIEALKQAGKLKPSAPFYLIFESVSLLETGHAGRLAETVAKISEDAGMPVALVILDTMARAMAGGDENSGQDMTAAVRSIDAIRAATGAHVAVVHHCGKDEARGARGHSSLRAAVDTEIEVSRAEGESISTVRVTKQRDLQAGEPMPFSLKVVELGIDRRGKPITSCTVHHEDSIMASSKSKAGRKPEAQPDRLLELLPQPSTTAWQKLADSEMGYSKSSFYRCLDKLKAAQSVRQQIGGTWDRWNH